MEKYPHGTRVSQFYFPSSSLRCSDPVFFFDIANLKSRSSNRPPSVQLFNRPDRSSSILCSSFFLYSSESRLFLFRSILRQIILLLFFFKIVLLQVQKSSLRDSVLLFRTQVYKLEIYVASYVQLTKWESSFRLKSSL